MQHTQRTIDPHLLRAIAKVRGSVPHTPYDLKKIKVLELTEKEEMPDDETIQFFRYKENDFSVIAEMENLHTLLFQTRNALMVADFSFLEKCQKLKKLDLVQTNFTDCALLLYLPALRYVRLPERSRLIHTQILDILQAKIEFAESVFYNYPIEQIVQTMKEKTKKLAFAVTAEKDIKPDLFDCKFGGVPYWDSTMAYPTDADGNKMMLLAQINFEQSTDTVQECLPQQGILQFFIVYSVACQYGYDFDEPDNQNAFRVVYHETVDYSVTREQVLALNIPVSTDRKNAADGLIGKEIYVKVTPKEMYMPPAVSRFDTIFRRVIRALKGEDIGKQKTRTILNKEDFCYLQNTLTYHGNHMLGYPIFESNFVKEIPKYYDTMLLQIYLEGKKDLEPVLWMEEGVVYFFINSKALANRDFRKVLYYWDTI